MRRYLLITTTLFGALLFTACVAPPAPPPEPLEQLPPPEPAPTLAEMPQFSVPTFQLSELPQLTPYDAPREIIQRYYDEEFVDTLQPADDYGRLYPYEGKIFGSEWWESRAYFGLADEQGRVVVDPVYRYTYFTEPEQNNGQVYLVLAYPIDEGDKKAQELLRESDGWIQRGRYVVASADGSWVSNDFYGDNLTVSGDRVIITNYSENPEHMWSSTGQTYSIYDMQGQFLASGEGQLGYFYEGLTALYNSEKGGYCYVDTNGQVAIPGPFFEAYNFQNGRAVVAVGKDWDNRLSAVINTQGEYVVDPSTERLSGWDHQENYLVFDDMGNSDNRGITDREGNIIAPAIYGWINIPYEGDATLAAASKSDNSWWLIDLQSGDTQRIDLENATINYVWVCSGNWCVVEYTGGAALLKGDKLYRFDARGGNHVNCNQIKGEMFAISGVLYDEQNRPTYYVDIFDAGAGRVEHTVTGAQFSHMLNDELLVMSLPENFEYMRVLNLDTSPAFNGELNGEIVRSIGWLADDVYSVRTTLFSGLIQPNGEWMIRVNINTID